MIAGCYKAANSERNLAVQLVRKCFTKLERATSNCTGIGKVQLSPTTIAAVKNAIYSIYPVKPAQTEKVAWREYKHSIDGSCCQLTRSMKRTVFYQLYRL